ncbi:ribonuclease T2 family protein [Pararhodobacter zhoushanensis]|uniref:Ribonuclease T n=1 Tax=Pararhodobacter zhoushanensis TaxID=2479545 RepID=A0ABT3H2I8_9RHOB|nr:ribonuclease T [Pararhodobacter zhoushanensis]MCW1933900.1 ribonuclease T [Pararhodobacter zhoushanensis]
MQRLIPAFAALLPIFAAQSAAAQDRAGAFDHYLLALSWIPAYCATDGDDRDDPRCRDGSAIGWAVHGLWPQNAGGDWPEYCTTSERAPSRRETAEQADLFGTPGAAWHQWNKHGRCSGLSAAQYYRLVRAAAEGIALPPVFEGVNRDLRVGPEVVEAAFIEANPDLTQDRIVTSCPGGALVELRLCLTRDLEPMDCGPALTRRECRLSAATLLPLR